MTQVWRIDVGMSAGVLDARPEVLELVWDEESGESEVRIVAAARADPVTTSPTPNII